MRHDACLLASAFRCLEPHAVFEPRPFAAETRVDRAFSMASAAQPRLGGLAEALERDIRALIRDIAPDGQVIVSTALIGRRPGEGAAP